MQPSPHLSSFQVKEGKKNIKASEICDVVLGKAQRHCKMPGEGKKQAIHGNGEKTNCTCASTPTTPPPTHWRQRHLPAVSGHVLARESGKSLLPELNINLASHFFLNYGYFQVQEGNEGQGGISLSLNTLTWSLREFLACTSIPLECSRSTNQNIASRVSVQIFSSKGIPQIQNCVFSILTVSRNLASAKPVLLSLPGFQWSSWTHFISILLNSGSSEFNFNFYLIYVCPLLMLAVFSRFSCLSLTLVWWNNHCTRCTCSSKWRLPVFHTVVMIFL